MQVLWEMSVILADSKNKINAKLQTHQQSSRDGEVGFFSGLEVYRIVDEEPQGSPGNWMSVLC